MNKLLIITVLVTLVALSAESFIVPRPAPGEKTDLLTKITDGLKSSYEKMPGDNLRLKAEHVFNDVAMGVGMFMYMTYSRINELLDPQQ